LLSPGLAGLFRQALRASAMLEKQELETLSESAVQFFLAHEINYLRGFCSNQFRSSIGRRTGSAPVVKKSAGNSKRNPAMNTNIVDYIVSFTHLATDLVTVIYLALAATHLVIMKCYDGESKRPHAFCAGLSAVLYLLLAVCMLSPVRESCSNRRLTRLR
jgi:hypothetical protein